MPRRWKDNEPINIKYRRLYTVIAIGLTAMDLIDIMKGKANFADYFNLVWCPFILWGMWLGGFYKIQRRIMEWRLKRRDNRFDYFST